MITFCFPGEHPDYHSYEALQIFNDCGGFPALEGGHEFEYFRVTSEDGKSVCSVSVPHFDNSNDKVRFMYGFMSGQTGYSSPWGCLTGVRPAKTVNHLADAGLDSDEIYKKLTEYYSISKEKALLSMKTASVQDVFLNGQKNNPQNIGIYIGIPFCPTRCLYCSFPSNSIDKYKKRLGEYLDSLYREIDAVRKIVTDEGLNVESVYLGGGTPTSLPEKEFGEYLSHICDAFVTGNVSLREFSLEAGRPDSFTENKLSLAFEKGCTRISVNPQTMNDETLKLIGRHHTSLQTCEGFELARKTGFKNINMDIIAGLPGEDISMFSNTLERIRKLGPDSVTVHTLSVKRAAELRLDPRRKMLQSENVGRMVSMAHDMCESMGLRPFYMYRQKNMLGNHENVCYCRPGLESPYNVHIMEEDQTILAMGAGAVSKLVSCGKIVRAFNVKGVEEYIERTDEMIERKKSLFSE